MEINNLIEHIEENDRVYHIDIIFLKNRAIQLLERENYLRIKRLHRWLEELLEYHHNINF